MLLLLLPPPPPPPLLLPFLPTMILAVTAIMLSHHMWQESCRPTAGKTPTCTASKRCSLRIRFVDAAQHGVCNTTSAVGMAVTAALQATGLHLYLERARVVAASVTQRYAASAACKLHLLSDAAQGLPPLLL